jgi:hypothetical protein
MKNLFFLLAAVIFSFQLMGQSIIDKHYTDLQEEKNATVVQVSGNLFSYVAKVMPEEEEDMKKAKGLFENIESFSLISVPDLVDPKSAYEEGISSLKRTHEDLLLVRDKKTKFSLYIDEENDIIRELVGIGNIDTTFIVFSLLGNISLDQLSEITDIIQKQDNLPFTPNQSNAITDFKVFPNPVAKSSLLTVEVPEDLIGGEIRILDMSGKLISTVEATTTSMEVSIDEATLGSYIIDLTKGEMSVRKQVLVIE